MSKPYSDAVQGVANASGALTLRFLSVASSRWLVAAVEITGMSPQASATVFAGIRKLGFVDGITDATASGIRCRPGEELRFEFVNLTAADSVRIVLDGDTYDQNELIPAPQFISASAVLSAFTTSQFGSGVLQAGTQTATIVTPPSGKSVRVLNAFVDVTGDCTAGGGVHVGIRLWNITQNTQAFQLRRIWAPNAIPAGAIGSFPGPFMDFGSGIGRPIFGVDDAVGIQVGTILTNGDVIGVLGYALE